MGRALFSSHPPSEPVVRSQSPPVPPANDPYATWSVWNNFDPDSDEFFDGAQYEAFLDPDLPCPLLPVDPHLEDVDSSESSSEGGDNDRGSPMAVGSDDPVDMIASAYSGPWDDLTPEERRYAVQRRLDRRLGDAAYMPLPQAPAVTPAGSDAAAPSRLEHATDPTVASTDAAVGTTADSSGTPLAAASIAPIDIPVDRSMGRLSHPMGTPSPSRLAHGSLSNELTPSPPPAFTPRIYTWSRLPEPSSPSPAPLWSAGRSLSPASRMNLARVTPIRVQGFTVAT